MLLYNDITVAPCTINMRGTISSCLLPHATVEVKLLNRALYVTCLHVMRIEHYVTHFERVA